MVSIVGVDSKVVKRVSCKSCASILEYTPNEARTKRGSDYSGDSWLYDVITCPKCSKDVEV